MSVLDQFFRSDDVRRMARQAELRHRLLTLAKTVTGEDNLSLDLREQQGGSTDGKGKISVGDPAVYVEAGFSEDMALKTALSVTIHEGAHIKFDSDVEHLNQTIKDMQREGANGTLAFWMLDFAEDLRIDARMAEERPGYGEIRAEVAERFVQEYVPTYNEKQDAVRVAAARMFGGVDLSTKPEWGHVDLDLVDELVNTLDAARYAKDCAEAIEIGRNAYKIAFGNEKFDSEDDSESKSDETGDETGEQGEGGEGGGDGEGGGEEYTFGGHAAFEYVRDTLKDEILSAQQRVSSRDKLLERDVKTLEQELFLDGRVRPPELVENDRLNATDIHAGMQSWYDTDERMKRKVRDSGSGTATPKRFPYMETLRKDIAKVLAEQMRKRMAQDSILRKTGSKIHASKIWRAPKLHRDDVMVKKTENAVGGWHVDIWVDMSGSNSGNESKIKAFLIPLVQALRDVGMGVRLYAWATEEVQTIQPIITSPDHDVQRINTHMYVGWDNRDGYAYRTARYLLKKVNAEHKLLILVSDGLPQSNAERSLVRAAGGLIPYDLYRDGMPAIYDAAKEVRECRKLFPTLGILIDEDKRFFVSRLDFGTGDAKEPETYSQRDLAAEIFGRDFVAVGTSTDDVTRRLPLAIKNWLARNIQG